MKTNFSAITFTFLLSASQLLADDHPFIIHLNGKAENIEASIEQNDIMRNHIQWITENSKYLYNDEALPDVEFVNQATLNLLVHGDYAVAQSEFHGTYLPDAKAGYDAERNVITLLEEYSVTDPDVQYMLVHELVHYLQNTNGIKEDIIYASCPIRMEEDAYRLQRMWMIENNDENPLPNPLFVAFLTSACETK